LPEPNVKVSQLGVNVNQLSLPAHLDPQVLPALLDNLVNPANPVALVVPENPADLQKLAQHMMALVSNAHLELPDRLVQLDNLVALDNLATLVIPAHKSHLVHLDPLDHPEMLVHLDKLVNPANLVALDKMEYAELANLDQKAHLDSLDTLVNLEDPVNLVALANLEIKDHLALLDNLVNPVAPEDPDSLAMLVFLAPTLPTVPAHQEPRPLQTLVPAVDIANDEYNPTFLYCCNETKFLNKQISFLWFPLIFSTIIVLN